ncbi:Elongation factor 1-gamma [Cytospora mali]|uniref:Elongation factor 1-gamma n=1 Tax=Cytospora mali TaxID=578113 RepID=A0A194V1U5_CYTMA|nr:Elongation factor 1-gamma [Valsa mali var. pyri (nom. inval.)]
MAPFGTIYTYPHNFRVQRASVIAALNGLELNIPEDFKMGVDNKSPEFLAKFPLGKVPVFEDSEGFRLSEASAIATYLAASGPLADQLLGADPRTKAKIAEWTLYTNTELVANFTPAVLMLFKFIPFDEAKYNFSATVFQNSLAKVEAAVKDGKKFLVGEQLTLADLEVAAALFFASGFLLDAEMRKTAPATIEYVKGIAAIPEFAKAFGEYKPCETRVKGGA